MNLSVEYDEFKSKSKQNIDHLNKVVIPFLKPKIPKECHFEHKTSKFRPSINVKFPTDCKATKLSITVKSTQQFDKKVFLFETNLTGSKDISLYSEIGYENVRQFDSKEELLNEIKRVYSFKHSVKHTQRSASEPNLLSESNLSVACNKEELTDRSSESPNSLSENSFDEKKILQILIDSTNDILIPYLRKNLPHGFGVVTDIVKDKLEVKVTTPFECKLSYIVVTIPLDSSFNRKYPNDPVYRLDGLNSEKFNPLVDDGEIFIDRIVPKMDKIPDAIKRLSGLA